jgi:hypothetical protein
MLHEERKLNVKDVEQVLPSTVKWCWGAKSERSAEGSREPECPELGLNRNLIDYLVTSRIVKPLVDLINLLIKAREA